MFDEIVIFKDIDSSIRRAARTMILEYLTNVIILLNIM